LGSSKEGIFHSIQFLGHARVGIILCTALGFEVEGRCTNEDYCAASQTSYCYFSKNMLLSFIQFCETVSRYHSCLWLIHKTILAVYVTAVVELQSGTEWNKTFLRNVL